MNWFSKISNSSKNIRIPTCNGSTTNLFSKNFPSIKEVKNISRLIKRRPKQKFALDRYTLDSVYPLTTFTKKKLLNFLPNYKGLPCVNRPLLEKPVNYLKIEDPVVPILSWDMKKVGEITLNKEIFCVPVRVDIIHKVVRWLLDKKRQGTHKAKTRAEVRGGGRKPHPQKGRGMARAGSIRSPNFRHGGRAFPQTPHDYEYNIPKKIRKMALKMVLSQKLFEKKLFVVDSSDLESHKTKNFKEKLIKNKWSSVLIVGGKEIPVNLKRATAVLKNVSLRNQNLDVYSVMHKEALILSKEAVNFIHNLFQFTKKSLPYNEEQKETSTNSGQVISGQVNSRKVNLLQQTL